MRSSYGQIFGPFPARGESGSNGRPNIVWVAAANVTVPPGYYTVLDSDPDTRSYNDRTTGHGFAIVRGSLVSPPKSSSPSMPTAPMTTPTTSTPEPCPLYPNGDCRGPGCVHPDLIAYGGNGPCGSGVTKSVHNPYKLLGGGGDFYYTKGLVTGVTVAMLAHDCAFYSGGLGRLVLLDDEPYYYYFRYDPRRPGIPAFAVFGCRR